MIVWVRAGIAATASARLAQKALRSNNFIENSFAEEIGAA
jgi:hypothetical protein